MRPSEPGNVRGSVIRGSEGELLCTKKNIRSHTLAAFCQYAAKDGCAAQAHAAITRLRSNARSNILKYKRV